jgi:DNA-binding NarL/FixJ family response regulator
MPDVVLVDDHKLVRDGIRGILERSSEFRVVGEAGSGVEAVTLCKKTQPHIAVMDIGLPGMNGIEATRELQRQCPQVKVVILSMHGDESSIVNAIRSGARGYVLKKASASELVDALRTVAGGGSYLSSGVADRLLTRVQRGNLDVRDAGPLESLTPRELQVMRLVAEGKANKDIAGLLNLGQQTVRSYRKTMMKKLGVSNAAGVTRIALALGLIERNKHHALSDPPSTIPNDSPDR